MTTIDRKAFWEAKLIGWEEGRYAPREHHARGPLEWIADRSSMSLRFRLRITVELLRPFLAGRRIVEIGCGSGLLVGQFLEAGATSYVGYDIAEVAIDAADRRKLDNGWGGNVQFRRAAVGDLPKLDADLVISLGLLDWLTDHELAILFERQGGADFLHAIAERRWSWQQWLHRSYVHLAYGRHTGAYVPRYFRAAAIAGLAARHRRGPFHAYRDRRLSFGALISSLPVGSPIA